MAIAIMPPVDEAAAEAAFAAMVAAGGGTVKLADGVFAAPTAEDDGSTASAATDPGHGGGPLRILRACAPLENLRELDPQPSAVEWEALVAHARASGDADCASVLGSCYYCGVGVPESAKEAAQLFRAAAEQGHAQAQCKLGWCYEIGEGVEGEAPDMKEAARLYRLAAAQGHVRATFNLGMCFEKGEGVGQRDAEEAGSVPHDEGACRS